MYPPLHHLVDGQWLSPDEGEAVLDPATGEPIAQLGHATADTLAAAAEAAARAFPKWRDLGPARRAAIILEAARLLRTRVDAIAPVLTLEQGKPVAEARGEILRACEIIEWDANEGRRAYGRVVPAAPGLRQMVVREPIGPVAAFSPWNFPFGSPARKLAGALSAGCTIVLKASEETPASALLLARAFVDAGVPAGVLNLVFGIPGDISNFLVPHPAVRLVTFTGSVPVGKRLAALCGLHMKPAIMELGGHGPALICDDVDPVKAARAAVDSKSRNAGQICTSPTRFLVQDAIHAAFTAAFVDRAAAIKVGPGLDPASEMGPLANLRRVETTEALVADAVAKGARLLTGGRRMGGNGYFYPLTVLADVPGEARVMQEEPFGPVAVINRFADLEDAIAAANSPSYGLAAYGFTASARRAEQMIEGLRCGNLGLNHFVASTADTPLGGVADSGYGREGGTEGIQCYTVAKCVSHRLDA